MVALTRRGPVNIVTPEDRMNGDRVRNAFRRFVGEDRYRKFVHALIVRPSLKDSLAKKWEDVLVFRPRPRPRPPSRHEDEEEGEDET